MTRAYDRKYIADAKTLNRYLTKLPTEKVPKRDIYTKLENRFKALPKKYRMMVSNIDLLDDYYDRLVKSEGGIAEENNTKTTATPTPKMKPVAKPQQKEDQSKKKKHWLW